MEKEGLGRLELIKKFMEDKEGVSILCTNDRTQENIKEMKDRFTSLTGKKLFLDINPSSFYKLFHH